MPEDIRSLSAELARDPSSLVFLTLAEALRKRNQGAAAERVLRTGLERHPHLADAHDLLARIHADRYEFDQAFEEWTSVLELAPRHAGAHQGIGFLYFRAGELERALAHLEEAARLRPDDSGVIHALETVRAYARERQEAGPEPAPAAPEAVPETASERPRVFDGLEGAGRAMVLLDRRGRLLAGAIAHPDGTDCTEQVAALLAGVSEECDRTSRLLEFGPWTALSAEAVAGHAHVVRPTAESLLLVMRDRSVPLGRVALLAERGALAARRWLEAQR